MDQWACGTTFESEEKGDNCFMKKRIIAFLLSFAIVLGYMPLTGYASMSENEYGIEKTTDEKNRIIRVYTKNNSNRDEQGSRSTDIQENDIKKVLLEMGFGEEIIDNMPEEELNNYCSAKTITTITSYTCSSSDGSVHTISEAEALSAIQQNRTEASLANSVTPTPYEDSYMRIVLTITEQGGGLYHYGVIAAWLTSPNCRFFDSLGICIQECALVNNSRGGYMNYTREVTNVATGSQSRYAEVEYFDHSNFRNTANGSWDGSAAILDLPGDDTETDEDDHIKERMYNIAAYYYFDAYVQEPDGSLNFNVTATYSHAYLSFGISPEVSIGIGKDGVSASIGLSFGITTENRSVETETPIHYVP